MSFAARLLELLSLSEPSGGTDAPPDQIAAAALLLQVARVDGRWAEAEDRHLDELLRSRFRLSETAVERLLGQAGTASREDADVTALVGRLSRAAPDDERRRLLGMAYALAASDGSMHEFEEDLIWRVGLLLGFDEAEISSIRRDAVRSVGQGASR